VSKNFHLIGKLKKFSINHLANLQKLELGMSLALETFVQIIKPIHDPSKLKSLRFHLEKSQKQESYLLDVQAFLENCLNLEELSLKTEMAVYPNTLNRGGGGNGKI